ncbi:hypothetical protein Halsa_0461 [Halanaerobium hydrogeniformans]|uniref:Uncharacterized protein n=1 Tax=Halanaerobium hydrogeniformans TaxID=656519 RepID=E4RPQ0_HALHG|nr:hypothetical protein Halsa_0461 [Halanaerobium hydrogeniformans]
MRDMDYGVWFTNIQSNENLRNKIIESNILDEIKENKVRFKTFE